MLEVLTFVLAAMAVILVLQFVADRTGLPAAALLTVAGLVYGVLPGPNVTLDPHVILTFVIPPLIYSAALNSSLLAIRENMRTVISLSIGLVLEHEDGGHGGQDERQHFQHGQTPASFGLEIFSHRTVGARAHGAGYPPCGAARARNGLFRAMHRISRRNCNSAALSKLTILCYYAKQRMVISGHEYRRPRSFLP